MDTISKEELTHIRIRAIESSIEMLKSADLAELFGDEIYEIMINDNSGKVQVILDSLRFQIIKPLRVLYRRSVK